MIVITVEMPTRSLSDRFTKYIVDPRRMTHNYLLQITLSLFVTGPCFMDAFFNAMTTEIISEMGIKHSQFALFISIPSLTGVVSAVAGLIVALYGSTMSAIVAGTLSFLGSAILMVGISTSTFATVMIGRIVFYLFWSLLTSFQTVIIFKLFRGTTLAWVFALQIFAIRLGMAGGMYFAGTILDLAGSLYGAFRIALLISGGSLMCTFAFAYLYRGSQTAKIVRPLIMGRRGIVSAEKFDWSLSRDAKCLCAVIFLYYGGFTPFESFGVDFLICQYKVDRDPAGKLMSSVVLFSFLSPVFAPMLTNIRRQLNAVVLAGSLVAGCMMVGVVGVEFSPFYFLCMAGMGHLFVVNGLWLALAGVCKGESEKANAASIGSALNCVSTCVTSWLTGKIRDVYGNYDIAFSILAGSIIVGTFVAGYVKFMGDWRETMLVGFTRYTNLGDSIIDDPITERLMPSPIYDNHFIPKVPRKQNDSRNLDTLL